MAIAASKHRTSRYILTSDRNQPEDARTVWIIGTLSRRAMQIIKDGTLKFEVIGDTPIVLPQQFSMCAAAVKYGLTVVENFRHEDGSEVKLKYATDSHGQKCLSEESLDLMLPYIEELGNEILRFNRLSETDLGNLPSPQNSSPEAPGVGPLPAT